MKACKEELMDIDTIPSCNIMNSGTTVPHLSSFSYSYTKKWLLPRHGCARA